MRGFRLYLVLLQRRQGLYGDIRVKDTVKQALYERRLDETSIIYIYKICRLKQTRFIHIYKKCGYEELNLIYIYKHCRR